MCGVWHVVCEWVCVERICMYGVYVVCAVCVVCLWVFGGKSCGMYVCVVYVCGMCVWYAVYV